MTELKKQEIDAQNEEFVKLCYEVFETDKKGKRLLEMLKESLIEKSPVADPNKGESFAYFREGQNHLVRSLIANIEQFKAQK